MGWSGMVMMFVPPILMIVAAGIAVRRWHRRRPRVVRRACAIAGAASGVIIQTTFTLLQRQFSWDFASEAIRWITLALVPGSFLVGLIVGHILDGRPRRREAS